MEFCTQLILTRRCSITWPHVAKEAGVTNLRTVLGEYDDPKLPVKNVDVAFFHRVLHMIEHRQVYLNATAKYLKPDGRVVVIDKNREKSPDSWMWLNQSDVDTWMAAIGFYPAQQFPVFDDRYFVVVSAALRQERAPEETFNEEGLSARPASQPVLRLSRPDIGPQEIPRSSDRSSTGRLFANRAFSCGPCSCVSRAGDADDFHWHPGEVLRVQELATEMSSSMASQWTPTPPPINSQADRWRGEASASRGNHTRGAETTRPSVNVTESASCEHETSTASASVLSAKVLKPFLQK